MFRCVSSSLIVSCFKAHSWSPIIYASFTYISSCGGTLKGLRLSTLYHRREVSETGSLVGVSDDLVDPVRGWGVRVTEGGRSSMAVCVPWLSTLPDWTLIDPPTS